MFVRLVSVQIFVTVLYTCVNVCIRSALALKRRFTTFLHFRKRIKDRLCITYDQTLIVFSSYGIIIRDSVICTAYGHTHMKYTYIDTTRQSIASSYNDREAL